MAFLRYHVVACSPSGRELVNGFFTSHQLAYEILPQLEKKYGTLVSVLVTPVYLTHLPKYDVNFDYESQQGNIR